MWSAESSPGGPAPSSHSRGVRPLARDEACVTSSATSSRVFHASTRASCGYIGRGILNAGRSQKPSSRVRRLREGRCPDATPRRGSRGSSHATKNAAGRPQRGTPKPATARRATTGPSGIERAGKYRRTKRTRRVLEARNARGDLLKALRDGNLPANSGLRVGDARDRFIVAARDGIALNKWGRRYRRRAVDGLQSALQQLPDWLIRRRFGDVQRGDMQRVADELVAAGLSARG